MLLRKNIKTKELDHTSNNIRRILLLSATSDSVKIVSFLYAPITISLPVSWTLLHEMTIRITLETTCGAITTRT